MLDEQAALLMLLRRTDDWLRVEEIDALRVLPGPAAIYVAELVEDGLIEHDALMGAVRLVPLPARRADAP